MEERNLSRNAGFSLEDGSQNPNGMRERKRLGGRRDKCMNGRGERKRERLAYDYQLIHTNFMPLDSKI